MVIHDKGNNRFSSVEQLISELEFRLDSHELSNYLVFHIPSDQKLINLNQLQQLPVWFVGVNLGVIETGEYEKWYRPIDMKGDCPNDGDTIFDDMDEIKISVCGYIVKNIQQAAYSLTDIITMDSVVFHRFRSLF